MNTCVDCGEETLNPERCRNCDIQRSLDGMECSVCHRMRYRTETPFGNIGAYFWGDPCACDPKPPTLLEFNEGKAP